MRFLSKPGLVRAHAGPKPGPPGLTHKPANMSFFPLCFHGNPGILNPNAPTNANELLLGRNMEMAPKLMLSGRNNELRPPQMNDVYPGGGPNGVLPPLFPCLFLLRLPIFGDDGRRKLVAAAVEGVEIQDVGNTRRQIAISHNPRGDTFEPTLLRGRQYGPMPFDAPTLCGASSGFESGFQHDPHKPELVTRLITSRKHVGKGKGNKCATITHLGGTMGLVRLQLAAASGFMV
ncbi:unnamed protein product [Caenorhabditis auriculariae]|uniref:Uncharacterized protein n=1 Tax=Caenorhabditis auriculariae TaxID=2777116 RepID=A0A8S1HT27_9PELO|nr:unnamed protein product [Caenorhabditis auriculariae]